MTSSTAAVDGGELEEAVVLVEADAINLALLDSIEELAVEPSGRPGEEEVVWGLGFGVVEGELLLGEGVGDGGSAWNWEARGGGDGVE